MFLVELQRLEDRKIKLVVLRASRARLVDVSNAARALKRISKRLGKARLQTIPIKVEKRQAFLGDVPFVGGCFAC